jgi:hypothetical protein
VEAGIDSMPISDVDDHATQNHHFRAWAWQEPGAKEVVPQIEVELNPHVGLAKSYKGRDMQDPWGGQVMQF